MLGGEPPPVYMVQRGNAASDGRRILINPRWLRTTMAQVCNSTGCDLGLMFAVAAHEVTHHDHLDAFLGDGSASDSHYRELRADFVAAHMAAWRGVSRVGFRALLRHLPNACSHTHPARDSRARAMLLGFEYGKRRIAIGESLRLAHSDLEALSWKCSVVEALLRH